MDGVRQLAAWEALVEGACAVVVEDAEDEDDVLVVVPLPPSGAPASCRP